MAAVPQQALPLALIYQADALHQHLKQALSELGANVVYETHAAKFSHGALDSSGAQVIIINLDPAISDEFEALSDLLLDEKRRVIFNDGEVTSRLEGWDLARWTRHLAAKVVGATEVNPPRPIGAEAIPVKVKSVAPAMSEAANESTQGFKLEGDEFQQALSADTGVAMARERAALSTAQEAVRPNLIPRGKGDVPYNVDPAELTMHLPPDVATPAPASEVPTLEIPVTGPVRTKQDIPTLEIPVTEPVRTKRDIPTLELPVDSLSTPVAPPTPDRHSAPTLELDTASLGLAPRQPSEDELSSAFAIEATPLEPHAARTPDASLELSLDEALLAAIDAPFAAAPSAAPAVAAPTPPAAAAPPALDASDNFGLGAELLDMPDLPPGEISRLPSNESANEIVNDDFADALRDFGFLDDEPAAPRGEQVMDLDTLLIRAGEAEHEQRKGTLGKPPPVFAPPAAKASPTPPAKPAVPTAAPAKPAPVAAKPAPSPAKPAPTPAASAPTARPATAPRSAPTEPPKQRSIADLESALSKFSLEPTEDDAPAKPAAAAPPAARAPAAPAPRAPAPPATPEPSHPAFSSLGSFSLEPLEGEQVAKPKTGRAVFEVPEVKAAPAPVPSTPSPVAPRAPIADDELALEGYDFNFDETTEIKTDSIVRLGSEAALDDMSVDLDSEIDALLMREAGFESPAAEPARISRVFVLGASIGGPDAVREFLGALPADVPALFLLAQHMGADFLELMVQQLTKATKLRVRTVANGDVLSHGEVVVVPVSERLTIEPDGVASVGPMPSPSPYSPSIDLIMRDVADRFGANAGAIVFSGMAHDAIEGSKAIAAKGGVVWVQDPTSCVISSMVDGARDAGVVGFTGRPLELARNFINEYAK